MAVQIKVDDFIKAVKLSGVVKDEVLEDSLSKIRDDEARMSNASTVADSLIADDVITKWQAENLLQGKYKNFFLGKYRLLGLIGKGGMGAVYLAEHTMLNRRCAIKVLPSVLAKNSNYIERFIREAQAVAAMDHPNIVRAYDVDKDINDKREMYYLTMEYVQGRDVEDVVKDIVETGKRGLDYVQAADIIRQTADGLAYAHKQSIVHRDIKPANLLLTQKGVVKILDMGLARNFDDDDAASLTANQDATYLGTPDYLAPEQAIDCHDVDGRADIYSLGCSLYYLLVGNPPFNEGTIAQRLVAHQTKAAPPVRLARPDAPQELIDICDTMMEKKREDRYQTADEVSSALAGWLVENAGDEWIEQHPGVASASGSGIASLDGLEEIEDFDALDSLDDIADLTAASMQSGIGQSGVGQSGIGSASGVGSVSGVGQARPFGSGVHSMGASPYGQQAAKKKAAVPMWAIISGISAGALAIIGIITTIVLLSSGSDPDSSKIDEVAVTNRTEIPFDPNAPMAPPVVTPAVENPADNSANNQTNPVAHTPKDASPNNPSGDPQGSQQNGTQNVSAGIKPDAGPKPMVVPSVDSTPAPLPKLGSQEFADAFVFDTLPARDLASMMTWAVKPEVYRVQESIGVEGRKGLAFDTSGSLEVSEMRQEFVVPSSGIIGVGGDFQLTLNEMGPPTRHAKVISLFVGTTGLPDSQRLEGSLVRDPKGNFELVGLLPNQVKVKVPADKIGLGKPNQNTAEWLRLEIQVQRLAQNETIHGQIVLYSLGGNGKGNAKEIARAFDGPSSSMPAIWNSEYWAIGFSRAKIDASGVQHLTVDQFNVAVHEPANGK